MRTLINICSPSYSGSTYLGMVLGNGPDAFHTGEVYAKFRPRYARHHETRCSCDDEECPWWQAVAGLSASRFVYEAFDCWDVPFIVDSSKELTWVCDTNSWCRRTGVRVVNLVVWKGSKTYAYSRWRRGHSLQWARDSVTKYFSRFFQLHLPYIAVSHDQLVVDPLSHLRRVCQCIGMPWFEGKEAFWETTHHHLFGNEGPTAQAKKRLGEITAIRQFPKEFNQEYERFEREGARASEYDAVIRRLNAADVMKANVVNQPCRGRTILPRWYYTHKLKGLWYRLLPQRNASTGYFLANGRRLPTSSSQPAENT